MNEQQFALEVRKALDESAERLPYRVSHRLQAARRAAIQRMPRAEAAPATPAGGPPLTAPVTVPLAVPVPALASSAGTAGGQWSPADAPGESKPLWWRAAVTALLLLALVAGFEVISAWHESDVAEEMADVDLAVLTDKVPISAYADRGFGVYLKNSHQ